MDCRSERDEAVGETELRSAKQSRLHLFVCTQCRRLNLGLPALASLASHKSRQTAEPCTSGKKSPSMFSPHGVTLFKCGVGKQLETGWRDEGVHVRKQQQRAEGMMWLKRERRV